MSPVRRDGRRDAASRRGRPRRRVVPLWRSRSALIGVVVLAIVAAGGGLWWVWQARYPHHLAETVSRTLIDAAADLGFRVDEVFVVGRHHTSKDAILAALGVERGAPIFILDLNDARKRILTLPWVRSVSIERLLPDTLVVRIVERQPVALWQQDHDFSVIDEDGAVIPTENVGDFGHLLVVVGGDAPVHALELIEMLDTEPDLNAMVKAAVRIGSRRWDVYLAGGIDVRLPADGPLGAWRRLAAYQKQHHLFERGVRSLDLRLDDRIVIGPGAEDPDIKGVGGDDA